MAVVVRKPFANMLKTRTYRLHAMGIIKTNEPGVIRRMQCQAVPDAVRSFRRSAVTGTLATSIMTQ